MELKFEGGVVLLLILMSATLMVKHIYELYQNKSALNLKGWGGVESNYVILVSQILFVMYFLRNSIGLFADLSIFILIALYIYGNYTFFWRKNNNEVFFYYFSVTNGFVFLLYGLNVFYLIIILMSTHIVNSIFQRY